MEDILKDINAVVGVTGCFVCDGEGRLLTSALPDVLDAAILPSLGRTIPQTTTGLSRARRRKVRDIDLLYAEGRVVVKPLREGCLCILCVRDVNVPLLNLIVNLAARKLADRMKEMAVPAMEVEPGAPVIEPLLAQIVGAYPDLVSLVTEFEQTLEEDQKDSVLSALGCRAGEMIFEQRCSSMGMPAS